MIKSCKNCQNLQKCKEVMKEYNKDYGTNLRHAILKNDNGLLEDCWEAKQ